MTDNKEKDMQTNVETEEIITEEASADEIIVEEVVVEEVAAEEMIDEADTGETGEAAGMAEKPKKEKRIRGFFKGKKLAIGIAVLIVLLVANVTVFGAKVHKNKGHHGHGGKTVEREYKAGNEAKHGDKVEVSLKEGGRAECKVEKRGDEAAKGSGKAEKGKGDRGDKAERGDEAAAKSGAETGAEAGTEDGAAA